MYDDVIRVVESINKLRSIHGIHYLLSSWSDPQKGKEAYKMIEDGLAYLQSIHNAILGIADETVLRNPMKLCKNMVHKLGLPEVAINPLVAKSFALHLKIFDRKHLSGA